MDEKVVLPYCLRYPSETFINDDDLKPLSICCHARKTSYHFNQKTHTKDSKPYTHYKGYNQKIHSKDSNHTAFSKNSNLKTPTWRLQPEDYNLNTTTWRLQPEDSNLNTPTWRLQPLITQHTETISARKNPSTINTKTSTRKRRPQPEDKERYQSPHLPQERERDQPTRPTKF